MALAGRMAGAWDMPELVEKVLIGYNPRMRTALGRAWLKTGRVDLNPHLLRRAPKELVPTLAHELAHVAAWLRYGRSATPHGQHFRTLMRAVNLSPDATHKVPTEGLKRKRQRYLYLHTCGTCGFRWLARSVRRRYYCRACGPDMQWEIVRVPDTPAGRRLLNTLHAPPAVD
jgi:predicted SprT family Zn-dependent metalloprotease